MRTLNNPLSDRDAIKRRYDLSQKVIQFNITNMSYMIYYYIICYALFCNLTFYLLTLHAKYLIIWIQHNLFNQSALTTVRLFPDFQYDPQSYDDHNLLTCIIISL